MSELQPDGSRPAAVQAKVAQAKQDEVVLEYLAQAKRLQGRGDLDGALQELSHAQRGNRRESDHPSHTVFSLSG